MKRLALLIWIVAAGCSDSGEFNRARAKFWGIDDALRRAEIEELKAITDGDSERAESERNRQRDLEGQLRVAELEYIAAGGDPNDIREMEQQAAAEVGSAAELKQIEADMAKATREFQDGVKRIEAGSLKSQIEGKSKP